MAPPPPRTIPCARLRPRRPLHANIRKMAFWGFGASSGLRSASACSGPTCFSNLSTSRLLATTKISAWTKSGSLQLDMEVGYYGCLAIPRVGSQFLKRDDHLSNEVSIGAKVTNSGLSAVAKSRAISALDRLLGSLLDVPASKLEVFAKRIRARGRLEEAYIDAVAERFTGTTSGDANAVRLVDEIVASQLRLLVNKGGVARRAVDYLTLPDPERKSTPESNAEEIDPDWLNYFAGYAEKTSSEKVQDLWAKVLAGEIRHPGSFSLMTLRLLAELDQRMASWFQEEVEFRIMGQFILQPENFRGERLERYVFLEQVGLVHHVSPIGGICHTFDPEEQGCAVVIEGDLCLRIHIDKPVKLSVIRMTRVGKEIANILPPVDPRSVLTRLASALHGHAKSIDICRVLGKNQDQVRVSDPIKILKPANTDSN